MSGGAARHHGTRLSCAATPRCTARRSRTSKPYADAAPPEAAGRPDALDEE
ncbi:hypothetical protein [Streptomyces sp. Da 82-17]|uniref:hypothetical protein n=1 Tax=Streptomyces sp. Da 82-17 TaxID=3377116 RepID=UPI0038D4784E